MKDPELAVRAVAALLASLVEPAASYTATAADTGAFLRVTPTSDDEHGSGHTAVGILPHVVTGALPSSLSVSGPPRDMAPAFDPATLLERVRGGESGEPGRTTVSRRDARCAGGPPRGRPGKRT